MPAPYVGDFRTGKTVRKTWNSNAIAGESITRATNGTVSVYKDGNTTQSTTGVTDTEDFDSLTGVHLVAIDTSADGTFYSAGSDFEVVLSGATIDGKTINASLFSFSLENRSHLMPTTDGRKLDVSAGGEAGVDWANIGSPTTTVALSGTTVKTATDVETDTQDIQSRLPAALGANGNLKADVRDFNGVAGTFASGRPETNMTHIAGSAVSTSTAQLGVNVVNFGGSAGTFAGGIPAVNATQWGGTDVASAVVSANVVQLSGDSVAADNAESFFDGTGYAGTNNVIPTVTTLTNGVTVSTNNDKTGYRLSATGVDDVWDELESGHAVSGSFGVALTAAKTKTAFLPSATAGSAGGVMIAGSNAAVTFDSFVVTNGVAITAGLLIQNNAGHALELTAGGGGNGSALYLQGDGTGDGIEINAGATGNGIHLAAGGTSGVGIFIETFNGHGIQVAPVGSSKHGVLVTGGNGGTSDGIQAVAGTGGVPIRGDITGNITGNISGTIGSLATQAKADVNAEVVDALATDTYAEIGQGTPAATNSLSNMIRYLYKMWRNKKAQNATEQKLFADDGTTVDQKATVSNDGTTTTVGKFTTGP